MQDIHGYEGLYGVTSCGRVWSYRSNRFLTQQKNAKGYPMVHLSKDGESRYVAVHRLVAEHYIPNPNGYETVDHIDGNKEHNYINNLQWMTREDNLRKSKCKRIRCIETGQEFNCYDDAAASVKRSRSALCNHINGRSKHCGGYHWEVIE